MRLRGRRGILLLCVLCTMLFANAAVAAASTVYVNPAGADNGGNCGTTPATACATIQQGVTNANNGDVVSVAPGTYVLPTGVLINKSITLAGAQYGVDARSRSLPASPSNESIVTGNANGDGLLVIAAPRVVIDGFTVQGNANGQGITATGSTATDYQIRNNIIDDNQTGIFPNSVPSTGGGGSLISRNQITNNNQPGASSGSGIYTDGGSHDLTVRDNAFSHDANGAALFVAGGNQSNINIVSNSMVDEGQVIFNGVQDSSVSGNTFSAGGGATNPLLAVLIDGGHNITISGNTVDGLLEGAFKIYDAPSFFGADQVTSGVQILGNNISNTGASPRPGHAGGAIQVIYDGTTYLHPYTGTLEVHGNRIAGGGDAVVNQDPTVPIDASENFWGCNAGANGGSGCSTTTGSAITTEPHLVLSLTADQSQLVAGGESTGVHPSLATDSNGNTATAPFATPSVALSTTLGSVTPNPATLDSSTGTANARLTSGNTPGTATVTATLDAAAAVTHVAIVSNAGPQGSTGAAGPAGTSQQPSSCLVPDVGGLTKAAASAKLEAAGCTLGNVTTASSSHVKKGDVLSQGTRAGSKVPTLYPVNLVISSGPLAKTHLTSNHLSVRRGRITLQIVCPRAGGRPCNGSLKLRTTSGKHMTLGTHAFQAPAGRRRSVTFTLSRAQLATLASEGTVKAQVFILARNKSGKASFTRVHVTIKG